MQAVQTSPSNLLPGRGGGGRQADPQGGVQPATPLTNQTLVPAKFRVTRETPNHRCVGDPSPQRERGVQGQTTTPKVTATHMVPLQALLAPERNPSHTGEKLVTQLLYRSDSPLHGPRRGRATSSEPPQPPTWPCAEGLPPKSYTNRTGA